MIRLFVLSVLLMFSMSAARAETRVALVIGNGAYANVGALENPGRDATAVAKALRNIGFQTVQVESNLGHDAMLAALRRFESAASDADWALVYYAGHGIEVGGMNYLVPVDAHLRSDRDVDEEAVSLSQVQKRLEGARKLRIVILDACRENPFRAQMRRTQASSRSIGRGLSVPDLPQSGSLVAFAADAGELALDDSEGWGRNSPYAAALVKTLAVPNLEVNIFFRRVRTEVLRTTNRHQLPATYEMLQDDSYVFNPATQSPSPPQSSSKVATLPVAPLAVEATEKNAKVEACDRLTASAFDEERPPAIPPVWYADIKPEEAIKTCSEALTETTTPAPAKRRLHFELGRALQAAQKPAEASVEYAKADAAGSGIAAMSLWRLYNEGIGVRRDEEAALGIIRKAAERGYAPAMTSMGFFHRNGSNVVRKDVGAARGFWLKAAELGNGSAMVGLATLSFNGEGTEKDAAAGKAWLDRAESVAKHDLPAMAILGQTYLYGGGIPADQAKAKGLFETAAAAGSPLAMMELGDIYAKGLGVPRDTSLARHWYEKAVANGLTKAKGRLDALEAASSKSAK